VWREHLRTTGGQVPSDCRGHGETGVPPAYLTPPVSVTAERPCGDRQTDPSYWGGRTDIPRSETSCQSSMPCALHASRRQWRPSWLTRALRVRSCDYE
jgi:hypothetical protein